MNVKRLFIDLFFATLLILISLALIFFYFNANYLDTGYADWIVQAFRVKLLDQYGLNSWTHTWSNGISIWRSYQFVPHYLTIGFSHLFNIEIARAMVLLTIVQFVALRLIMYVVLRLLKFSPITAFICAILSFAIGQYWNGVSEYSLLFAFTFFPIIIYLWTLYYHGKIQYVYPYIAGLCFYIHPMLGFSAFGLWAFSVLFSERKIISWAVFFQLLIILSTSSLFWFPVVSKMSYFYANPVFSTKYFLDLAIAKYSFFGLSLFIFIALFLSLLWIFKPIPEKWGWTKVLLFFSISYLTIIIIGVSFNLPGAIYQFQYSRGTTLIGIAILFSFALVVEHITHIKSMVIKGVCIFVLCLSLIEGIWFTSIYSPQPLQKGDDVVSKAVQQHKIDPNAGRILTPTIDWSSYLGPLNARYPYSYMEHMDSNQIPQRLSQMVFYHPFFEEAPEATIKRLSLYYKITGTKYLLFEDNSPFAISYRKKGEYTDLGKIEASKGIYQGFEVPWEIRNAVLIAKKDEQGMTHFPFNLKFSNINDQIELDSHVEKFVDVLYRPTNIPLTVTYPTSDSLQIAVPKNRSSNLVYVNESHDVGWKAYLNGREQKITPTGPNYMLISIDNLQDGGTLILKHTWPLYFFVGIFLILLVPIEIAIVMLYKCIRKQKKT